jgi:hypothetical protein
MRRGMVFDVLTVVMALVLEGADRSRGRYMGIVVAILVTLATSSALANT